MLFMEIYGSLGNANVINIYLQHVSKWPSCPHFAFKIKFPNSLRWGNKKKRYQICFAVQEHKIFLNLFIFFGGGGGGGVLLSH